ncbi:MAG TPA: hypothetical protein VHY37_14465 [Tepidisphaeraceae bacterium]|jgi:hypothetical protein|nr:hypothetical protein [Tepidisphaeraceae bacterium]
MPVEVENDPFFQLLTDALRAGPASPPWREAVAKLREGGEGGGADEYRLLIEARQNLEVGKSYRQVRPGPAFTRKVLTGVEESRQPGGGRRVPIAGIVAILAGIVLIGIVAYFVSLYIGQTRADTSPGARADELASTYFSANVAAAHFNGPLSDDWRRIGGLKLATNQGLHLATAAKSADGMLGGGVVLPQPLPADEPFASEAQVRPGPAGASDQLAEVFVSTSPDFSSDRATAPQELVWLIRGNSQQVVLDGQVVADKPIVRRPGEATLDVRLVMSKDLAVVEVDRQRIWAGPHGLGDSPRYVGVRILTTAPGVAGQPAEPAIVDWKILKK